jgi:hypothetical protein
MPKVKASATRWESSCPLWKQTEAAVLDCRDVEKLFHLQPRAALRLMEHVGPTNHAGEWQVDTVRVVEWFRGIS